MTDLEHAYMADLSEQLAKEIDFEIISDILCSNGWTKVVLMPMTYETSTYIDKWLNHNCKSAFKTMGLVWIFEDDKDAMWFKLRFSNEV